MMKLMVKLLVIALRIAISHLRRLHHVQTQQQEKKIMIIVVHEMLILWPSNKYVVLLHHSHFLYFSQSWGQYKLAMYTWLSHT